MLSSWGYASGTGRAGFDLDRLWSFLTTGIQGRAGKLYVTMHEFVRGSHTLGFGGNARLLFRGLDAEGRGQLWRRDLEALQLLAPRQHQAQHHGAPPQICELRAWAQELGGTDRFLAMVGLGEGSGAG
ncbi:unnamed protein product, partial [Prorocentrum cordatum]